MIAAWMAAATLFAVFLGFAAVAAERSLRLVGRQARGPWLVALAAAVTWPAFGPAVAAAFGKMFRSAPVAAPARAVGGSLTAVFPTASALWLARLDAVLLMLWVVASVALLARLALAMRELARVERSATTDVIGGVPVLITPTLGPAVFGARRPRMLVPRWLLDLDAPLRSLVLRHEQEHCRARDPQLTLAVAAAIALVPWNAGVWWIARRLRLAVELDCDARVLRTIDGTAEDPERYGRLLLLIAQRQSQTRLAPMLAESNSQLSRRINAMHTPRPANPRARVAVLTLVSAGALACATRAGTDLTSPPSVSGRTLSSLSPGGGKTYVEFRVDKMVQVAPGSPAPRYPSILRSAGVEGEVLAMFVVDTSGLADVGTLKIARSSHELFANAVRSALPDMRFIPAEVQGRKVKQLIQEPFVFAVAEAGVVSATNAPAAGAMAPAFGAVSASKAPAGGAVTANPAKPAIWTLGTVVVTVPPAPPGAKIP